MNNNTYSLVPFEYEGRQIRIISDEVGDPWFVAADLLASLGLDRKALERLDDDEKGVSSIHTPGGEQAMTIVNEPGMYNLVLGSRKKEAHRFKRWVTHEVLPAIRQTGPTPSQVPCLLRHPCPQRSKTASVLFC
ncbi:BRO family protein [Cyanobium sp. FGCU-6]|nr:BRO family protein [Cyanobium sp. FGCU6]